MPILKLNKKKRLRKQRPDEVFQAGPIVLARYGRLIVGKNIASPSQHKQIQERIPAGYAQIEDAIRSEIAAVQSVLASLDPLTFLQQAFGEFFLAHLNVEDEPSLTFDNHGVAARMIDYCQSLFAAMPAPEKPKVHSEEEFRTAKEHVRRLFQNTRQYIALRSHPVISGITNEALSELISKLTYSWVFIRSDRHAYFELAHHNDLIKPLDPILRRVLGLTSDDLLRGLARLLENAQTGIGDASATLFDLFQSASDNPEFVKLLQAGSGYTTDDLATATGATSAAIEDALHSFLGTRLFEVKRTTEWPDEFIKLLSFIPGQADSFLKPDERAAWPTRVWPIFQRPFLRLGSESYCFDYIAFCDRLYRHITRALRAVDSTCSNELNDIQAANVESIAAKLLQALLPGASVFRNVFYLCNGELCETDLILTYKDTIVVAEVRSASITPESPTEDLNSYFVSIENLLLKPCSQAWRLLTELNTHPIQLYNSNRADRHNVGTLNPAELKFRIPMAVSLDHLHMMGSHFANTLAGLETASPPVWAVTLDDLRCFGALFESPSIFLHFAQIRLRAASRTKVEVFDEMDHVGMYFKENDYVMQTEEFDARLARQGYTQDIDRYFFGRAAGRCIQRPRQEMPSNIAKLVTACDRSAQPSSRALASAILDPDSETRLTTDKWLADQLRNPPNVGRLRNLTLNFDSGALSLMFSQRWTMDGIQQAFIEAKARLINMRNVNSSLVALIRVSDASFNLASCSIIKKADIGAQEAAFLRPFREAQEMRDFVNVTNGVGRNDQCPCGSGAKFKRCHGR
jgi:hypothetical protein